MLPPSVHTVAATVIGTSISTTLEQTGGSSIDGLFVATTLVVLLSFYDILGSVERDVAQLRTALLAVIAPLLLTFCIVIFLKAMAFLTPS